MCSDSAHMILEQSRSCSVPCRHQPGRQLNQISCVPAGIAAGVDLHVVAFDDTSCAKIGTSLGGQHTPMFEPHFNSCHQILNKIPGWNSQLKKL